MTVGGEQAHLFVVVDGEDEVGGVPSGSARVGQRPLVDLNNVAPPQFGQMPNHRVAHDPGADHHNVGGGGLITHDVLLEGACSFAGFVRPNPLLRFPVWWQITIMRYEIVLRSLTLRTDRGRGYDHQPLDLFTVARARETVAGAVRMQRGDDPSVGPHRRSHRADALGKFLDGP